MPAGLEGDVPQGFHLVRDLRPRQKLAINSWSDPGDPSVYGRMDLDVTEVQAFLDEVRHEHRVPVTITHVVIKLVANFLARCPDVNGIIAGKRLYRRDNITLSSLVALDEGRDLMATKLTDVDRKGVVEIAQELREKAGRIRRHEDPEVQKTAGILSRLSSRNVGRAFALMDWLVYRMGVPPRWLGVPQDPFGGAIVTSVGMLGIDHAYVPLIWFSRVPLFILVGEIRKQPAVVDDQVVARPMVTMTCTFDHRFMDGAQAALLAEETRAAFRDPRSRLLGTPPSLERDKQRPRQADA